MNDAVDISTEVKSLCQKLDVQLNNVAEIHIYPYEIFVSHFLVNEHGKKYAGPTGKAAMGLSLPAVLG